MDIRIQDLITLDDDNEYIVVSKIVHKEKDYIYIVDINNNQNMKFMKIDNDGYLIELNYKDDEKLIKELIPLFLMQR